MGVMVHAVCVMVDDIGVMVNSSSAYILATFDTLTFCLS